MATKDPALLIDDALELASLLRPAWADMDAVLRASGVPLNADPPVADPPADPPVADPPADPPAGPPETVETWKGHSRKHETRAKAEKTRADTLQAELDDIKKSGQSEHEKALDEARTQARTEALTEADAERRSDRLEVAVTRLAVAGITVGEGDDAKTVKFDPDALVFIERAVAKGDADDIFDSEGKVQTAALTTALVDLLKSKPNLAADDVKPAPGDADAGKGRGAAGDLASLSVDEHLARVQAKK